MSAESYADADFVGSPRDFVRKQPVQADARQHKRQQSEKGRNPCDKPLLKQQAVNLLRFGCDVEERQIRIELCDRSANRREQSLRVGGCAQLERYGQSVRSVLRHIHRRADVRTQVVVFGITNHADDLVAGASGSVIVSGPFTKLLSNGILFAKILRDERLIHDHRRRRRSRRGSIVGGRKRVVGGVETASR